MTSAIATFPSVEVFPASTINDLTVTGNVGSAKQLKRFAESNSVVLELSVAVKETKEKTSWYTVKLWGNNAENMERILAQYITEDTKDSMYRTVRGLHITAPGKINGFSNWESTNEFGEVVTKHAVVVDASSFEATPRKEREEEVAVAA